MKTVHILGAGLGGLVAAINLARAGYDVLVIESAKGIGGIRGFHPSLHVTPMDLDFVNAYTGLDIAGNVKKLDQPLRVGLWEDEYLFGKNRLPMKTPLYGVERGTKETSMDYFLYSRAKALGVKFLFSTFIKKAGDLPPGSIIATGLHPEMYKDLEIPHRKIEGFSFCVQADKENEKDIHVCMGDFATDYYYSVAFNGLYYGLLFQRNPMEYKCLVELEKMLSSKAEKVHKWVPFTCCGPTKSFRQPQLFRKGKIMGGSMAGVGDPVLCFGIHGALLSGQTAALAVMDPQKARQEFSLLTHYYRRAWIIAQISNQVPTKTRRRVYRFVRYRVPGLLARYGYYLHPFTDMVDKGIPGYWKGYFSPYIVPHEKEKKRAALFDKALEAIARLCPGKNAAEELEALKKRYITQNAKHLETI